MPRKPLEKIEVGTRIDKLVVIAPADDGGLGSKLWKVRCDCGREILGADSALRSYRLHTCGCSDGKEDLTGQRFGKLTVVERTVNSPYGKQQYLCHCDCGNDKVELADYLMYNYIRRL